MPDLSIILPFHNEAATTPDLFRRLYPVLGSLGVSYEIICIDDGSSDNTYNALHHERDKDHRVKLVRMARNFGKEAAMACGLRLATGRAAITMDSDLQHPPETIRELVQKWQNGAQLVYAVRRDRKSENALYRFMARSFYAVFRRIAEVKLPEGAGDFCLLDRIVIDAVNALPERNRFMKGLVSWVGFRRDTVVFDVARRAGGATTWNYFRLLRFAFDGLSAFSTLPLRIWTFSGAVVSLGALAYGIYLIIRTLMEGIDVPGYASMMVGILFLGGLQLLSLGMIGEYLARVITEVKARPLYFIAEHEGLDILPAGGRK
ncbi:MAG: glycosyltransferase family 2 protein [Bdellovibrionales bacterium]